MEPYFEDVIDEMDVDEDPVTTFDKLILLADDLIVPQKISVKDDMEQESVSEATENDKKENDIISRDTPQTTGYKAYEPDNIRMFLQLMQEEGPSVIKHTRTCFIPRSTAYEILKQWNESDWTAVPISCVKKPSKIGGAKRANNCKITA